MVENSPLLRTVLENLDLPVATLVMAGSTAAPVPVWVEGEPTPFHSTQMSCPTRGHLGVLGMACDDLSRSPPTVVFRVKHCHVLCSGVGGERLFLEMVQELRWIQNVFATAG